MTLDTNIIVAYLNGDLSVMATLERWKQSNKILLISAITTAEVLAFPPLTPAELIKTKRFLTEFLSIPFNDELADIAGLLQRTYGLKLPDAAIAATALRAQTPLVTRDKVFRRVKELKTLAI